MNNKLQTTYQKVKALETSMFRHIYFYLNKKEQKYQANNTLPLLILHCIFKKLLKNVIM